MTSIKREKQYSKIFLGYEARCGRENNIKNLEDSTQVSSSGLFGSGNGILVSTETGHFLNSSTTSIMLDMRFL
jgi:hypothetical protein